MTTVKELREQLVELGLPQEEADNIKGKGALAKALTDMRYQLDNFSVVNNPEEEIIDEAIPGPGIDINDPGWTDYVLSLLDKSEKTEGYPTSNGLRRIAYTMFEIISSETIVVQAPSENNGNIATIQHNIECVSRDGANLCKFSGVADAHIENTVAPYSNHLSATAETRAEGRALRRMMRLNTITAEEMQKEDRLQTEFDSDINDTQIKAFGIICKKLGLNVEKTVTHFLGRDVVSIQSLKNKEAKDIYYQIDCLQRDLENIPEELKGYDEDWQTFWG